MRTVNCRTSKTAHGSAFVLQLKRVRSAYLALQYQHRCQRRRRGYMLQHGALGKDRQVGSLAAVAEAAGLHDLDVWKF